MKHGIVLHTYDSRKELIEVPDSVVNSLHLVLHYSISGDEVYRFVLEDGSMVVYDAIDYVPDAQERFFDSSWEDFHVIFPDDMKWVETHEA